MIFSKVWDWVLMYPVEHKAWMDSLHFQGRSTDVERFPSGWLGFQQDLVLYIQDGGKEVDTRKGWTLKPKYAG